MSAKLIVPAARAFGTWTKPLAKSPVMPRRKASRRLNLIEVRISSSHCRTSRLLGSGTFARGHKIVKCNPDSSARCGNVPPHGGEIVFQGLAARARPGHGVLNGDGPKSHRMAGPQLGESVVVGRNHGGDLWITAGGLMVGQQHERVAAARHLHRPPHYAFGRHIEARRYGKLRAFEPDTHTINVGREMVSLGKEASQSLGIEETLLRARYKTHNISRLAKNRNGQLMPACGRAAHVLDDNLIASGQRPACEGRSGICRTASEPNRPDDRPCHGKIAPASPSSGGDGQLHSAPERCHRPRRLAFAVDGHGEVSSGDRKRDASRRAAKRNAGKADFDRSASRSRTEGGLPDCKGGPIHRTAFGDAIALVTETAPVLNGRQRTRINNLQPCSHHAVFSSAASTSKSVAEILAKRT